ncbi:MAG: hypothetical protein Q9204_008795 [Flavoplaca sp. TL-2023a]
MSSQASGSRHSIAGTGDLQLEDVPSKAVSEGYEKLARLMSLSPETAIFRRFQALNTTNLLRLQAELQDMEHELAGIRSDDSHSKDPVRIGYVRDFRTMRDWKETGDSLQYDLLIDIGKKLHKEVGFLRDWLVRPTMGNDFLNDIERSTWEDTNDPDFLTLFPRTTQKDPFTSLMNGALLDVYHRIWGHKRRVRSSLIERMSVVVSCAEENQQGSSSFPNPGYRQYDEARMTTISNSLAAILSSLLPTLAILVFYFIKSMLIRIVLTIIFTAMFSLALSVFTEARKVEIFSATAA